jgi:hypothetical protein
MEDGAVVSGESNKCLLHLWSSERNFVRRVLDTETRGETLRVIVQRIGRSKPATLEICRQRDPRTASAKKQARLAYSRILERALKRKFPDLSLLQLSTSMDLEIVRANLRAWSDEARSIGIRRARTEPRGTAVIH